MYHRVPWLVKEACSCTACSLFLRTLGMTTRLAHAGGFRDTSDTNWNALRFYTEADVDFKFYSMSWPLNVWALHVTQQGARFFGDQGLKPLRETWTTAVANWLVQTAIEQRYTECAPFRNADNSPC
jgi:hypothetical protein